MSEENEIKLNGFVNDLYEGMMYGSIKIESDDCKKYMDLISKLQQENKELIKYKNAWNELKNDNTELIEYNNRTIKDCKLYKNRKMYLLERKYELGGE